MKVSGSLEKPPRFPDMGVGLWMCEPVPELTLCVSECRRICVCRVWAHDGTWGTIPRESPARFQQTLAAAGSGVSLLTARRGQPLPMPEAL